ncbi:MAG: substrate-binding domain-containing protein, partial [Spirochaetota bacterium]
PRGEEARPGVATPRGEEARGGARRSGGSARDGSAPVPLYAHPLHDAAAARGLVVRVFEEHPRLGGIFVTNALVHLVGQALTELGRGTLPLIGYDVLPENRAQLEAGVIDFLISQRPGLQGRRAIMLLFEMLQHQGTAGAARGEPAREIMPLDMVTAENIGYYIDL